MLADAISEFIYRYFIVPGYDIVDTPVYGLILGVLCIYLVIPLVKRLDIRIDKKFILSLMPFIVFGASTRELVDQGFGLYGGIGPYPENFWLVSPGIYFTMFLFTLVVLIFSLAVHRYFNIDYQKVLFSVGSVFVLYNLALIIPNIENFMALLLITLAFLCSCLIIPLLLKLGMGFIKNEGNYLVIMAHLLDASATYVGIDFLGFSEQHVLPSFLIKSLGSAIVMYPLKLIVLIPAIYIIDKELKSDVTARRMLKLIIAILGLGPAIRDITLAILSV